MFGVPQILISGNGNPNYTSLTLVIYLNKHPFSENAGIANAVSTLLFIVSAMLSIIVYFGTREKRQPRGGVGK